MGAQVRNACSCVPRSRVRRSRRASKASPKRALETCIVLATSPRRILVSANLFRAEVAHDALPRERVGAVVLFFGAAPQLRLGRTGPQHTAITFVEPLCELDLRMERAKSVTSISRLADALIQVRSLRFTRAR